MACNYPSDKIIINDTVHIEENMDAYSKVFIMIPGETTGWHTCTIQTIDLVIIIKECTLFKCQTYQTHQGVGIDQRLTRQVWQRMCKCPRLEFNITLRNHHFLVIY